MEKHLQSARLKTKKTQSSVCFHKPAASGQIEEIRDKISKLEKKYSQFIHSCLSTLQVTENNKHFIELPMKKNSKSQINPDESQNFSQIVDHFVNISRVIPEEYEDQFTDFKTETLKYIFRLQNKVPKVFKLSSPENKTMGFRQDMKANTGVVRLKDSNQETEETSQFVYTGELSRSKDSGKNVNRQFGIPTKQVPRLRLNRIDEFSPIQAKDDRICATSSRMCKKNLLPNTLRDSINLDSEDLQVKLRQTLKYTKLFLRNILNLCENYPEPEEKIDLIVDKCKDFSEILENVEKDEKFITADEVKLKEDLENCKKIALMYEKKLKLKNEAISVLRKKEKDWAEQSQKSKNLLILFYENNAKQENEFFEIVVQRIEEINFQFLEIEKKIKKNLVMGLEEIKKAVEMTSKNDFFDQQTEILHKNIQELEDANRTLYGKNKQLEGDLLEYRSKYNELENVVRVLKKSQEEHFLAMNELESAAMLAENLKKSLKIKEFELKQKEFENSELGADKNELLARIESLEIEKIESHECINSITIKYNQEIENFVYNNTVQRNQIQALEKEKQEYLKQVKLLENKLEAATKETSLLRESQSAHIKSSNQTENLLKELEKLRQAKSEQDTKLAGFEEIIQSKSKLEQELVQLKQSLKPMANTEILELTEPVPKENQISSHQYSEVAQSLLNANLEIESLKSLLGDLNSEIKDLKDRTEELNLQVSQLIGEKQILLTQNEDLGKANEKLESVNKYLLEDLKHRHQSYNEFMQDLKLDTYQYEKSLKSYESQIESLQFACDSLQSRLDLISPIPDTLNEALSATLTRNQIDSSLKNSYLTKIEQLEEDIKNLTTKLLKKNNENSILEDCLMAYSPRSKTLNSSQDEIMKIKCELIEAHKIIEDSNSEKKMLQLNLANNLNLLEDLKKTLEKNKQDLSETEKKLMGKNEENLKLKKMCEELNGECEKMVKIANEAKCSLKNSEVTYGKNLNYLEEQVKKYKKNEIENSGSFVLSPRGSGQELRLTKENSLIIHPNKIIIEDYLNLDPEFSEF